MVEGWTPALAADFPFRMAKLHGFLDRGVIRNDPAVRVSCGTVLWLYYWSVI